MKEERFTKMTIEELEGLVEQKHRQSRAAQKEMMDILIYLKVSGRYKENKIYASSTFFTYIGDRFNMRKGTFYESQYAWTKFPEASKEYGVGLVSKVRNVCGIKKAPIVIQQVRDVQQACKTPLKREKIEKIIQSHAQPKKEKTITDWKAMYETEARLHGDTKIHLKTAMEKVRELEAQVARLKAAAQKYNDICRITERKMPVTGAAAQA